MDVECPECKALHWSVERNSKQQFGVCCDSGQVHLPLLSKPPQALSSLYTSVGNPLAEKFRDNITQYNAAFAFTSLGVDVDTRINHYGPKHWVFRIHGNLRHHSGALEPSDDVAPSYSQLYLYDPTISLQHRANRNPNLSPDTMRTLQDLLNTFNPYQQIYQHAHEVL
ncbi:hypothetical protein K435DRAFT_670567, partial [Dendrothele bispora CBS 962.96]